MDARDHVRGPSLLQFGRAIRANRKVVSPTATPSGSTHALSALSVLVRTTS